MSSFGYRFEVGTHVECRTGPDEWSVGKITKLNYREPDWPPRKIVPYQVKLDDGPLIFVPADVPQLCRMHVPAWWVSLFYVRGMPFGGKFGREHLALLQEKSKGQDVNAKDREGVVALHKAIQHNWPAGVTELLKMKADVTLPDNNMVQALHMCVQDVEEDGAELMKILLKAKAHPNCQDTNPDYDPDFTSVSFGDRVEHRTPLHYCCSEGSEEQAKMVPILIQAKADLDVQDGQGKTPLHLAIEEKHAEFVDILLKSKADVNLGNLSSNFQNSPLMDAAHEGQCDVALKLISAKADINKKGKQGLSALHFAARSGRTKMVQILMEANADASQTSDIGTALDLAKKKGGSELLKLFGVEPTPTNGSIATVKDLDAEQRKLLFLE